MRRIIEQIAPPGKWKLPVTILLGIFMGLFVYVFQVSNASSYLSDKPETCMNCHVMTSQYATWLHSSHRERATCNDCHVPHNNLVNKYFFKAKDGMRHATIFTLRLEPQVIHIKEAGQKVVQQNCIRCHQALLTDRSMLPVHNPEFIQHRTARQCWECHRETPHGRVNSLSAVRNAKVPLPGNPVPEWLMKLVTEENNKNK